MSAEDIVANMSEEQMIDFTNMFSVRLVDEYTKQTPTPAQHLALALSDKELFWGGAAGGGKSSYLLQAALQYVDIPGYSALILRRTFTDLVAPGAILDRTKDLLSGTNVVMRDEGRKWFFPSGAKLEFGYAQRESDKYKFAGGEYQYIAFDEATHFEGGIYQFMFSRLRRPQLMCITCQQKVLRKISSIGETYYTHEDQRLSDCPRALPDPMVIQRFGQAPQDGMSIFDVPLRMRAASNPGGVGHEFFKARFINEETRGNRVFIPASMEDNAHLDRAGYQASLDELSPVERARLLHGDWDVAIEGNLFDRGKFEVAAPGITVHDCKEVVRAWDLAASEKETSDYTVGALVGITHDNKWVILDIIRERLNPHKVEALVARTASQDGDKVRIIMEQEPGSSGKNNISNYTRNILPGYRFKGVRSTGSKEVRAEPFAAQVEAGNVYMNYAGWNLAMLEEFQNFPNGAHDDQVDAIVSGFSEIAIPSKRKVRILA